MNIPATYQSPARRVPCLRRTPLLLLTVAAMLVPFLFASRTTSASPQAPAQDALAKLRDDWVKDLRSKKLEPILNFYAADAAFLQPNGDRITGSAALRTLFQNIMATFNSDLTLHSLNLEASGNLAYDSGEFEETLTNIATGTKIESKGSYVIIYKREANAAWRIVQHVWTGTPPPGT